MHVFAASVRPAHPTCNILHTPIHKLTTTADATPPAQVISFGGFERWYAHKRGWCIDDFVKYDQLSACLHDATILAWKEKIRIDAIRPASAIRYLRDKGALPKTVRSWGGAAAGFKTADVDPYKWTSYMRTM